MFLIKQKDLFIICSDDYSSSVSERYRIDTDSGFNEKSFMGYCFQDNKLFHELYNEVPDISALEDTYYYNCGVFCAIVIEKVTRIFTDPMGQYPVFYFNKGGSFIVSNNFFAISSLLKEKKMNLDCMIDYVTYLSPLKQETILKDVYRLSSFETLKIENNSLKKVENNNYLLDFSYDELLKIVADRMKSRAKVLLDRSNPLCHLTGGGDSRLALASLLSSGFEGNVFSYGDGRSEDRLISNLVATTYNLTPGTVKKFGLHVNDLKKYVNMVVAFNGIKSAHFSNWGSGSDKGYCEVTGYFGEIIKGFGSINFKKDKFPSRISYHDYYRKHSNFDGDIFDQADLRVTEELRDKQHFDSSILNNILFYLRNRCSSHCGMHSVVSNRRFISIDLDYDPLLLSLVNSCKYSEVHIKAGAITVDLIKTIHSTKLATLPYQGRVIPKFTKWIKDLDIPLSCTERYNPEHEMLEKMKVDHIYKEPDLNFDKLGVENYRFNGPTALYQSPHFLKFYQDYPVFLSALSAKKGDKRFELTTLSSLIVCELITKKEIYSFL